MSSDGSYVRVCPDCDAEFVSTVETCFDCGTVLETRLADAGADPAAVALVAPGPSTESTGPPGAPAAPDGWVPIETADLDWALELKDRLATAGVLSRLAQDCASCRPTLSVYVAPGDLAAANQVAQDVYLEKVPEAAGTNLPTGQETDRCPACGAGLSQHATSCPDCGLAFVPVEGVDEAGAG